MAATLGFYAARALLRGKGRLAVTSKRTFVRRSKGLNATTTKTFGSGGTDLGTVINGGTLEAVRVWSDTSIHALGFKVSGIWTNYGDTALGGENQFDLETGEKINSITMQWDAGIDYSIFFGTTLGNDYQFGGLGGGSHGQLTGTSLNELDVWATSTNISKIKITMNEP